MDFLVREEQEVFSRQRELPEAERQKQYIDYSSIKLYHREKF